MNNFRYFRVVVFLIFLTVLVAACGDADTSKPLTLADYPDSGSAELTLYMSKCGECHAAPLPTIHTEKQWPGVVQRMQFRLTSKAMPPLSKQELQTIVDYLQKHAKKQIE